VLVTFKALSNSAPAVARKPDHAPDAAQLVASVENQVSVVAEPEVMVLGLAEMFTVGSGDGTEGPLEGGRMSITGLYESAIQANEAIAGT
jgi:hypothetical protein